MELRWAKPGSKWRRKKHSGKSGVGASGCPLVNPPRRVLEIALEPRAYGLPTLLAVHTRARSTAGNHDCICSSFSSKIDSAIPLRKETYTSILAASTSEDQHIDV